MLDRKQELESFLLGDQLDSELITPDLPESPVQQTSEGSGFPSAADFSDEYFSIFPDANLDDVKKAYRTDYQKFLKDQGVGGAQLAARVARVESVFDNSASPDDIRSILSEQKRQKDIQEERTNGIERADRFINRVMSENEGLTFDQARSQFINYYGNRLNTLGFSDQEVTEKVGRAEQNFLSVENANDLTRLFEPNFVSEEDAEIDKTSRLKDTLLSLKEGFLNGVSSAGQGIIELSGKLSKSIIRDKAREQGFFFDQNGNRFEFTTDEEFDRIFDGTVTEALTNEETVTNQIRREAQETGQQIGDRDSLNSIAGRGVGSFATVLLGGTSKTALLTSGALLGAGEQSVDYFESVSPEKLSSQEREVAVGLGGLLGLSEALPASKLVKRFFGDKDVSLKSIKFLDEKSGGGLQRFLKTVAKGTTEEGLQEAFQQFGQNLIANNLVAYDPDRDTFQGVAQAGEEGAVTGALLNALAFAFGGRRTQQRGDENDRSTIQGDDTQNNNDINQPSQGSLSQEEDSGTVGGPSNVQGQARQTSNVGEPGSTRDGNGEDRVSDDLFGRSVDQELQDVRSRRNQATSSQNETEVDSDGASENITQGPAGSAEPSGSTQIETSTTQNEVNENAELEPTEESREGSQSQSSSRQETPNGTEEATGSESESSPGSEEGGLNDAENNETQNQEVQQEENQEALQEEVDPLDVVYPDRQSALGQVNGDSSLIFGNKEIGYGISNNPDDASDFQGLINDEPDITIEDLISTPTFSVVKKTPDNVRVLTDDDYDSIVDLANSEISGDVNTRINTVESLSDLPDQIQTVIGDQRFNLEAESIPGFTYQGQVYLVRDQINTREELQDVIYHELYGHAGLRNFYGNEIFNKAQELKSLIENDGQTIVEYADSLGIDLTPYENSLSAQTESGAISEANKDRVLIEEVLSHVVAQEQNPTLVDKAKELLALVVDKLRNTKLDFVARRFETPATKTRVLLRDARRGIRRGENNGDRASSAGDTIPDDAFAASRVRSGVQPITPREVDQRYGEAKSYKGYLLRDWFTSRQNIGERAFTELLKEKGINNVHNQRAKNVVSDLEQSIAKLKKTKVGKLKDADFEVITEYLSTSDSQVRNEIAERNDIFQDQDVMNHINEIDHVRDSMIREVMNIQFQTVAHRSRRLKTDQDLKVYEDWLNSVSGKSDFDFDSDSFTDFSDKHPGLSQAMLLYHQIGNSQGAYFNRSYKVHDKNTTWKWSRIPDGVKQRAVNEVVDRYTVTLKTDEEYLAAREVQREELVTQEGQTFDLLNDENARLQAFDRNTSKGLKKLQDRRKRQKQASDRAKQLGGWRQYINQELNGDNSSLKGLVTPTGKGRTDISGEKQEAIDARALLREFIEGQNEHADLFSYFSQSSGGDKSKSARLALQVLTKRGEFSKVMLDLMGEHRDIRITLPRSIGKSAELIHTFNNQKIVFDWLSSTGQLTAPGNNNAREGWVQFPDGKNWEFLANRYAPARTMDALISYGLVSGNPQDLLVRPFGTWVAEAFPPLARLSAFVKGNVTKRSPGSIGRNTYSAAIMALPASQGLSILDVSNEWQRFKTGVEGAYFKDPKGLRDKNLEWLENNVINQNVQLSEIRRLTALADANAKNASTNPSAKVDGLIASNLERLGNTKIGSKIKSFDQAMEHFFNAGDNYARIFIYERLKDQGKRRGLDDVQAKQFAASRLMNGYQTYDVAWKAAREVGILPVVGNFVTFQSEIARTSAWNLRYAWEDYQLSKELREQGDLALSKEVKDQANARLMSTVFAVGVAESVIGLGLTGIASVVTGLSEDDEEKPSFQNPVDTDEFNDNIRLLAGPWMLNSKLAYLGVDDEGKPSIFDASQQVGHAPIMKFLRSIDSISEFEDGDWQQISSKLQQAVGELGGGIFDMDIALGSVAELINNRDANGNKIFEESDTLEQKADIFTRYVMRNGLTPGYLTQLKRYQDAGLFGTPFVSKSGQTNTLPSEIRRTFGLKETTIQLDRALSFKLREKQDSMQSFKSALQDVVVDKNIQSDAEIEEAFKRLVDNRQTRMREVFQLIDAAEKTMSFSYYETGKFLKKSNLERQVREDIRSTLNSKNVRFNKDDTRTVMRGQIPALKVKISDTKKQRFDDPQEMSRRLRILDRLVREHNREIRKEFANQDQ